MIYLSNSRIFTHFETSSVLTEGYKFWPIPNTHGNWAVRVLNVPYLLWHGPTLYNGHLQGPMTLTPVAEHLAVELFPPDLKRLRSNSDLRHARQTLRLFAIVNIDDYIETKKLSDTCFLKKKCTPLHDYEVCPQLSRVFQQRRLVNSGGSPGSSLSDRNIPKNSRGEKTAYLKQCQKMEKYIFIKNNYGN